MMAYYLLYSPRLEVIDLGMRYKSYDIIKLLLYRLWYHSWRGKEQAVILDLTYGRGRFYRRVRRDKHYIIGVDIARHEWEVEPDEFHETDARVFVDKLLDNEIELARRPDTIVVDPPWSHEKRGCKPRGLGISSMPYHMKHVKSRELIQAAQQLSQHLGVPLIYRYKEPLPGTNVLIKHHVKIMRKQGIIYYGLIQP